ncbi:tetratricopeptide repeat protein [Sulfuricurvum sp. IAE1]|uniref:tetratricopeptide repeat protein n=1 Tax=Sulfuricurvum sp. IAE1 TaxID=2546102 RepID=UPI001048BD9B|nr:tetratricopeptide repeat protein [Sulfuricurvum sp. IAE1]TDA63183.1 tetratricopeptide repeat protein [Sulfuricurvum sp. IAE1]
MNMMLKTALLSAFLLGAALADERSEEGRRYLIRGIAAIEMAKSEKELAGAAEQFAKATQIAPELSAAWYNLGSVQAKLGRYKEAMDSYQHYLNLNPKAEDAPKIRDEIIKLEYRMEQAAKVSALAGTWVDNYGRHFKLDISGSRITLTSRRNPDDNDVISTYSLVGKVPVHNAINETFQLEMSGQELSGKWSKDGYQADKCTIPPLASNAAGEVSLEENKIVLRHIDTKYSAATQINIFDDFCIGVKVTEQKEVERVFKKYVEQPAP